MFTSVQKPASEWLNTGHATTENKDKARMHSTSIIQHCTRDIEQLDKKQKRTGKGSLQVTG